MVTRGRRPEDSVVVLARSDYERLVRPQNIVEFFRSSPLAEAVAAGELGDSAEDPFARRRDLGRDPDFG